MKIKFHDYLNTLKNKKADDTKHFVLGNASVDYDSFFGSILLAYLLTNLTDRFYIPIISCAKEDV
jgi:inorganic pyrophosphatase/exopolyphosphatase